MLYSNVGIVKNIVDYVFESKKKGGVMSKDWCSLSYNSNDSFEEIIKNYNEIWNGYVNQVKIVNMFKNVTKTGLFMLYKNDSWYSFIYNLNEQKVWKINERKTRKYFLDIEYSHPDMDNHIDIIVPYSQYLVGNEILSSIYIKRYLHYQNESYVFDEKYELNIMDSDLTNFIINRDKYIRLSDNSYEVMNIT
jgi:hypothetical protein